MERLIRAFSLIVLVVFMSQCSGDSEGPPFTCAASATECLGQIAGDYEGTYSGATRGTWEARVEISGKMTGSAYNTVIDDEFALTGTADENGRMVFGTSSDGAAFQGQISEDFRVSGDWTLSGYSGTFKGQRVNPAP